MTLPKPHEYPTELRDLLTKLIVSDPFPDMETYDRALRWAYPIYMLGKTLNTDPRTKFIPDNEVMAGLERWLKEGRDRYPKDTNQFWVIDLMLDDVRMHVAQGTIPWEYNAEESDPDGRYPL